MTITFYTFLFASVGTFFLADVPSVYRIAVQNPLVLGYGVGLGIVIFHENADFFGIAGMAMVLIGLTIS